MSQPSGSRTVTCRFCGRHYTRTNWMIRWTAGLGPDGHLLRDTHEIACAKKITDKKKENP